MAGGYTHLTLVREALTVCRKEGGLEDVISQWSAFSYLGGVSPDYPYLSFGESNTKWADLMHKSGTHLMIRAAIKHLFDIRHSVNQDAWGKKMAWLLGFVSHVVADVTIHPVVNFKVGKYEDHKSQHRDCEMNQDVHIYSQRIGLDLRKASHMRGELLQCGAYDDFSDVVEEIWRIGFNAAYQDEPDSGQIDAWNKNFMELIRLAERGRDFPVIGRYLEFNNLAYPDTAQDEFIKDLKVPTSRMVDAEEQPIDFNELLSFDEVFDKALEHIIAAWRAIRDDLYTQNNGQYMVGETLGNRHQRLIGNWSLDTGIEVDDPVKKLRLWPFEATL
jgi:hypothetical protein